MVKHVIPVNKKFTLLDQWNVLRKVNFMSDNPEPDDDIHVINIVNSIGDKAIFGTIIINL